jgi:hypothetical protein
MNPLKNNKQGTGIRNSQMGRKTEEKLEERKNLRKRENVAKHGVRLRCWQALQFDEETSQMPYIPNGT